MQYMVSTRPVATPAINIATPFPTDHLTDSIVWLPLWMIDETYDLTQLGAHVEIVLSIEDAEGGIRTTNRIYAAEPNVAAALHHSASPMTTPHAPPPGRPQSATC